MDLVLFGLFSKIINSSFLFGWQEIVKKINVVFVQKVSKR